MISISDLKADFKSFLTELRLFFFGNYMSGINSKNKNLNKTNPLEILKNVLVIWYVLVGVNGLYKII
jgi:hypothetical protein